jgi:site-specific recombinase XerD
LQKRKKCLPLHPQSTRIAVEIKDSVAQLVEQYTFNVWVLGSSPSGITKSLSFERLFLIEEEKPKHKTICEAFDYHNLKMADIVKIGKVSPKTLLRYEITKNKVVAFMQHTYKVDDKALPEMRLKFVTEFEHFLLTVQKIQSNTAHKYIKNLKKIMNMAVGLDWITHNPFNQFKCSYTSPEREILNQEELNTIMSKEFSVDRMNEVRDVFIFCCYTGFAYTDVYQFEQDAVTIGLDGEYWLSTNRQKTGTKESVPLLPVALEIIEKYRENEYCKKYNKLLPVNSNQRYNAYLKELADVCGIKKHLTSHIARHTFATTVTLANGVPIETVSSMLGHNSIRTTQIYAKVVEHKVSQDMSSILSIEENISFVEKFLPKWNIDVSKIEYFKIDKVKNKYSLTITHVAEWEDVELNHLRYYYFIIEITECFESVLNSIKLSNFFQR